MKLSKLLICLNLAGLLVMSCAQPTVIEPAAPKRATTATPGSSVPGSRWEALVAAARKEGTLTYYSDSNAETRSAISQEFYKEYGIRVEMVSSTGSQIVAKVRSERQAGLHVPDLISTGALSSTDLKNMGALQPMERHLILPEVLDAGAWPDGRPVFLDKDRTIAVLATYYQPLLLVNTDMVKANDISSNEDLLQPRWKGKTVFYDPTIAGTGVYWVIFLRTVKGEQWAENFFKQFIKQDVVITRDQRLHAEWVARGRYPVGIGYSAPVVGGFLKEGLPITPLTTREGGVMASGGIVAMADKAPHPNAAAVMVNWLLSHKGLRLFAEGNGYMPTRRDMEPTWVHPALIPPKGTRILQADEDFLLFLRDHGRDVARQYFGELIK